MRRPARILFLTVLFTLVLSTALLPSQGKKGQVQDPVCGLWVDKNKELSHTHKDETYYFCSNRDKETFKANPARYLPKK